MESFSTETYGGVGVKKVYLNKVPNYVSTLSYVYTINSSFFPASKLCIISANLSMVRIRYIHKYLSINALGNLLYPRIWTFSLTHFNGHVTIVVKWHCYGNLSHISMLFQQFSNLFFSTNKKSKSMCMSRYISLSLV